MRRWQVWFFGRWGQALSWIVVVLAGWFLVGYGTGRPRWWWPFERSRPAVVLTPADTSAPPVGWTAVAKSAMPAVVNALHLKLNEIVAALEGASNRLINLEDLTEEEVRTLRRHYRRLVDIAKREDSLTRSHSIEEAELRYWVKKRREQQFLAPPVAASARAAAPNPSAREAGAP
jgi:hypothetical protein